ncbi:MAG: hypothetical protein K0Q55_3089 [Verrucomicrobia bacterium]|nr:hypothetical protein [Verrucomicrobiota bacterium]
MLKGMGVTMALPLLEAMKPLSSFGAAAATAKSEAPKRLAVLFFPNGTHEHKWTPEGEGADFKLSPILEPLAEHKKDLLVFTNLWNQATNTGDGHYVKDAAFLTGTTITKTTGADVRSNGVSMDQLIAQKVGNLTPLPSLELGIETPRTGVDTNVGYTQLYGAHISWSSPVTPVAKEINPRLAFDRLFRSKAGGSANPQRDRSVLDLVMDDAKRLRGKVGHDDQRKLDEYFESVRAIERRIEFDAKRRAKEYADLGILTKEVDALDQRIVKYQKDPNQFGIDRTERVRLMLDLMVLAFWSDSTRVSTFMFGNSVSTLNFSFLPGVKESHHEASHHNNEAHKLEQYQAITTWFSTQYAYMLSRMKSIKEGNGNLLDNSMVLFGSGFRDGNAHNPHNLPLVLAGKAGGTLSTGRHLTYSKDTQLCNLYLGMIRRMGVQAERFGDSTGELAKLVV